MAEQAVQLILEGLRIGQARRNADRAAEMGTKQHEEQKRQFEETMKLRIAEEKRQSEHQKATLKATQELQNLMKIERQQSLMKELEAGTPTPGVKELSRRTTPEGDTYRNIELPIFNEMEGKVYLDPTGQSNESVPTTHRLPVNVEVRDPQTAARQEAARQTTLAEPLIKRQEAGQKAMLDRQREVEATKGFYDIEQETIKERARAAQSAIDHKERMAEIASRNETMKAIAGMRVNAARDKDSNKKSELNPTQEKQIAAWTNMRNQYEKLLNLGEKIRFSPHGVLGNIEVGLKRRGLKNFATDDERDYVSELGRISSDEFHAKYGSVLTPGELERASKYIPTFTTEAGSARTDIRNAIEYIEAQIQSMYDVTGAARPAKTKSSSASGKIKVRRKADGVVGEVSEQYFDTNKYEKVQ